MREASLIIAALGGAHQRAAFESTAAYYSIPFETAEGTWQGEREEVVILRADNWDRVKTHFADQEAVLLLGPQHAPVDGGPRKAKLVYTDGRDPEEIGWFAPVGDGRFFAYDGSKDYTKTTRTDALGHEVTQFYQVVPFNAWP